MTKAQRAAHIRLNLLSKEFPVNHDELMQAAYEQALKSYNEGGLPIGSVLADARGNIVAAGHNLRVQTGDPTAHAEVACIRKAGRRRDFAAHADSDAAQPGARRHPHGRGGPASPRYRFR